VPRARPTTRGVNPRFHGQRRVDLSSVCLSLAAIFVSLSPHRLRSLPRSRRRASFRLSLTLSLAHSFSLSLSLSLSLSFSSSLSLYIYPSRYGASRHPSVTPILALLYSSSPTSDRPPYRCISPPPRCESGNHGNYGGETIAATALFSTHRRSSSPSPPPFPSSFNARVQFGTNLSFFLSLSLSPFPTIAGRGHRTGTRRRASSRSSFLGVSRRRDGRGGDIERGKNEARVRDSHGGGNVERYTAISDDLSASSSSSSSSSTVTPHRPLDFSMPPPQTLTRSGEIGPVERRRTLPNVTSVDTPPRPLPRDRERRSLSSARRRCSRDSQRWTLAIRRHLHWSPLMAHDSNLKKESCKSRDNESRRRTVQLRSYLQDRNYYFHLLCSRHWINIFELFIYSFCHMIDYILNDTFF